MTSHFAKAMMAASLLILAGCASGYRGNIATFHTLAAPGSESVMITPILAEKSDSLEFQQYASILAGHLQRYGYKEPGDTDPELVAGFNVTITDGREKLETRPGTLHKPYWGGAYWAYGRYWLPLRPTFHDPWLDDEVVARTVYTATLTLELRKPDGEMVYEGRAELETRRKDLPKMVPYLAKILFDQFPGENGVTKRAFIEKEPKSASASD
jgi:hypothetical protein